MLLYGRRSVETLRLCEGARRGSQITLFAGRSMLQLLNSLFNGEGTRIVFQALVGLSKDFASLPLAIGYEGLQFLIELHVWKMTASAGRQLKFLIDLHFLFSRLRLGRADFQKRLSRRAKGLEEMRGTT